jgi:hypothetical protein
MFRKYVLYHKILYNNILGKFSAICTLLKISDFCNMVCYIRYIGIVKNTVLIFESAVRVIMAAQNTLSAIFPCISGTSSGL